MYLQKSDVELFRILFLGSFDLKADCAKVKRLIYKLVPFRVNTQSFYSAIYPLGTGTSSGLSYSVE